MGLMVLAWRGARRRFLDWLLTQLDLTSCAGAVPTGAPGLAWSSPGCLLMDLGPLAAFLFCLDTVLRLVAAPRA